MLYFHYGRFLKMGWIKKHCSLTPVMFSLGKLKQFAYGLRHENYGASFVILFWHLQISLKALRSGDVVEWLIRTPVRNSGAPGLSSWPGDRLRWLTIFIISSVSPSTCYCETDHSRFLSNTYSLYIQELHEDLPFTFEAIIESRIR
jgi:hypothetical protein